MIKIFLLLFFTSFTAFAAPKAVMIIRHAEKPLFGNELSESGEKRSIKLVDYFHYDNEMKELGLPNYLFAARPKNEDSSIRSIQTLIPLSKDLKLEINSQFTKSEYQKLADEILSNPTYRNKNILIAFPHGKIPELVHALGAYSAPLEWGDEVFDETWIIKYNGDTFSSFEIVKQNISI